MELRQNIRLKQQQKPVMSLHMLRSLDILILPFPELRLRMEHEMLSNPIIEEVPDGADMESAGEDYREGPAPGEDWEYYFRTLSHQAQNEEEENPGRSIESVPGAGQNLKEYLATQLHISGIDKILMGEYIIGNLDDDGYLRVTPAEISADLGEAPAEVSKILELLKSFDPPGVFASDLPECLLLQAVASESRNLLAEIIIKEYFHELKKKQLGKITAAMKADPGEVSEAVRFISKLNPRPGASFSPGSSPAVVPDVTVRRTGSGYEVAVQGEGLPGLGVSGFYRRMMKRERPGDVKSFISKKIKAAEWLIEAISDRNKSLRRITEYILEVQKDFFEGSSAGLAPLRLKDAAEKTGLSESTVSRAVAGKYIQTDRGIFRMKRFFSGKVNSSLPGEASSAGVKEQIARIVKNEPRGKPFSDGQISSILQKEGIMAARRTVSKYRNAAGILPASLRKAI